MRAYIYNYIANEVLRVGRYFDEVVYCSKDESDDHFLRDMLSKKHANVTSYLLPDLLAATKSQQKMLLLNGNLNYDLDIQNSLVSLWGTCQREDRVVCVIYNSYFKGLFRLANWLGLRKAEVPKVFITESHLKTLCKLSGFEAVRIRPVGHFPFRWLGVGDVLNSLLSGIPLVRWLSFASVVILRPLLPKQPKQPSVSVVVPARNEAGNIENAVVRMAPFMDRIPTELIFVEGHSKDNTWEEIERVVAAYSGKYKIVALRQTGKGKVDAVRLGFSKATGDLLTILDADLTMPPEMLDRFYNAWFEGQADFINGSRLVYPMEDDSMRFLNLLGNIFFAKTLSFMLDCPVTDSLCGTKLLSRQAYRRFCLWREDFGDFDPFGDFELIFPAAVLGLGVVDIPIVYKSRTYGSTNINRFRHGLVLLRMTIIGLLRIKLISRPK